MHTCRVCCDIRIKKRESYGQSWSAIAKCELCMLMFAQRMTSCDLKQIISIFFFFRFILIPPLSLIVCLFHRYSTIEKDCTVEPTRLRYLLDAAR